MMIEARKIKYTVLKTGSEGNAILLENGILLDAGVPFKLIEPYLYKIKAIFYSHAHGDHFCPSTARRIHELRPTIRFFGGDFLKDKLLGVGINKNNIDVIQPNKIYDYKYFKVSPFILFHDCKNFGLRIFHKGEKILYATDTKEISHITAKNYSLYLLEGNYYEEKIEENIKNAKDSWEIYYCQRAQQTHLSIEKASKFLMENMGESSEYRLIHSSKNNS